MITQKRAEAALLKLADNKNFKYKAFENKKFFALKIITPTEKGNVGEDLLATLLREAGHKNVKTLAGRRGEYDVLLRRGKRELRFEVKVATQDTNGAYQFNGIRYDTDYTHLFCLGIAPERIEFIVVAKAALLEGKHKMATMAKGSNAAFKLTKRPADMLSFDKFNGQVNALL